MPKLTDEKKWSDPWFRSLLPEFKLAWLYLIENVDLAGVIELDRELAEFQIRCHIDWEQFLAVSGDRVRKLAKGGLWIPKAVRFQSGNLSGNSPFVKGVRRALQSRGLLDAYLEEFPPTVPKKGVTLSKGYQKGIDRVSKPYKGEGNSYSSHKSESLQTSNSLEEVPSGPADHSGTLPGLGDAVEPKAKSKSKSPPEEPSRYVLQFRDGSIYRFPQRLVDGLKKTYRITDDAVTKEMDKIEFWLMSNPMKRPTTSRGYAQRIANWFSEADRRGTFQTTASGPPFDISTARVPAELQSIEADVRRWLAHLQRKRGTIDRESVREQYRSMVEQHSPTVVQAAIRVAIKNDWKRLMFDEARQSAAVSPYQNLN